MVGGDLAHDRGGALFEDTRSLVSHFSRISYCFVSRQLNRAAHHVAQKALSSGVRPLVDSRVFLSSTL
ncbi:unnamed protein product [Linum trigynum]|uniref:RNase H type-1 domain-containing protein n=1 Tax=Linum trigynum TaxID=586398 RepID=A0AAV2E8G6_9ROSI